MRTVNKVEKHIGNNQETIRNQGGNTNNEVDNTEQNNIYLALIYIAFDNINWEIMFIIMQTIGIDRKLVYMLYKNQYAIIRIDNETVNAKVKRR